MPARPATTQRSPARSSTRADARTHRRRNLAAALGPPFVIYLALGSYLVNAVQLLGLAIGVCVMVLMARRPERTLWLLVAILPFQVPLSALVYRVLPDRGAVRMIGLWKEAAFAALVIAAWMAIQRAGRRLDRLDRLCLAYLVLGTVFLVAGSAVGSSLGAGVSIDLRFACWRSTVLPIALFMAARHLRISAARAAALLRAVTALGVVLGVTAVVEIALPGTWMRFLVDTVGIDEYRSKVLDASDIFLLSSGDGNGALSVGGYTLQRIGGLVVSPLTLAFLALLVVGVVTERLLRRERVGGLVWVVVLAAVTLAATQTRSAILGLGLATIVALRPSSGRSVAGRVRFALIGVAILVASIPLLAAAGGLDRFVQGAPTSDQQHRASSGTALELVLDQPLGYGLGTGTQGALSGQIGAVVPENQFLDVALQLGVAGLVLILAIGVSIVRRIRQLAPATPDPDLQTLGVGVRTVLIGLFVPCFLLQPFLGPEIGWVVFALAGGALGGMEATVAERDTSRDLADPLGRLVQ
jgi:hypothetical protein